jgi:hypothetical protein
MSKCLQNSCYRTATFVVALPGAPAAEATPVCGQHIATALRALNAASCCGSARNFRVGILEGSK